MAGSFSRDKGKRGEREAIQILQPAVDAAYDDLEACGVATSKDRPLLQRNTVQSDRGGYDVIGLPWLALEVKNAATLQVPAWWKQTLKQTPPDGLPLLMWKVGGGRGWRARTTTMLPLFQHPTTMIQDVVIELGTEDLVRWLTACVYRIDGQRLWERRQRNGLVVQMQASAASH